MSGAPLARIEDIPERGALIVSEAGASYILTRVGAAVHAFNNRCAHAAYQLDRDGSGRVLVQEGRFLVCAHHGASYALESGACAGGPCNGAGLTRVGVEVRDGAVYAA